MGCTEYICRLWVNLGFVFAGNTECISVWNCKLLIAGLLGRKWEISLEES